MIPYTPPKDFIEITANKESLTVKRFFAGVMVDRYLTHDLLKCPAKCSWAAQLVVTLNNYQRCAVCGWPLQSEQGGVGCERGNCSMRPWPEEFFDAERMAYEYGQNPVYALGGMPDHTEDWQREANNHQQSCLHDRLNEDGICRQCGADCRGAV